VRIASCVVEKFRNEYGPGSIPVREGKYLASKVDRDLNPRHWPEPWTSARDQFHFHREGTLSRVQWGL